MSAGKPVCYCFNVTEADIRAHFASPGASYDELVRKTAIGTKCTACLFDLDIVMESIHKGQATVKIEPGKRVEKPWSKFSISDFADSGFFVCDRNIGTTVHLSNFGQLFGDTIPLVDFEYELMMFDGSGALAHREAGCIDAGQARAIELASIKGCPEQGWFLVVLRGAEEGFFGTLRPQIALNGPSWSASYHTQPHAMATTGLYRHSVITQGNGETLATHVSVINGVERAGQLEIELSDPDGRFQATSAHGLASRGSAIIDLDRLFPGAPVDAPLFVTVRSDRPTRKHIINEHRDGSWSVDHFPN